MTDPIWTPDENALRDSRIVAFARAAEAQFAVELPDYGALWRWSTERPADFWLAIWRFFDVRSDVPPGEVLTGTDLPGAHWFPGVRLNYVDQVFRDRRADDVAVVAVGEDGAVTELTWAELERRVASVAATLRELGVRTGDRVVGYLPNTTAPLIGFLATASLGAIWSCCAPDYAAPAAGNRLAQLDPVVLITADGYRFGGRDHDRRPEAVRLAGLMPALRHVLHVRTLGLDPLDFGDVPVTEWRDAETAHRGPLSIEPVPFEHPLWVLFSSGTTGRAEGPRARPRRRRCSTHLKIGALHCDLRAGRPAVLVHHHQLDDVELQHVGALWSARPSSSTTAARRHPDRIALWQIVADRPGSTLLRHQPRVPAGLREGGRAPGHGHDLCRAAHARRHRITAAGRRRPLGSARVRGAGAAGVDVSGGTDVVSAFAFWAPDRRGLAGRDRPAAALGVALRRLRRRGAAGARSRSASSSSPRPCRRCR